MARNTADDYRPAADDSELPLFACQRHSATSVAAAKAQDSKKTDRDRAAILELLAQAGPLTDEQISERTGLGPNTARPRRVELLRAGLVAKAGDGRTSGGFRAALWGRA